MSGKPVEPGFVIPPLAVGAVDPQRMKTMSAIMRDPYPIHWDRDAVAAMGLGHRTINQGALNLGYIANMLMDWAGEDSIRKLTATFHARVLDGDTAVARGVVTSLEATESGSSAHCDVWLERDAEVVVSGTAIVNLPA